MNKKILIGSSIGGVVVVALTVGITVPLVLRDKNDGLQFGDPIPKNDSRYSSIDDLGQTLFVSGSTVPTEVAVISDDVVEFQYKGSDAVDIGASPVILAGFATMAPQASKEVALMDVNLQTLADDQITVIRFNLTDKKIISLQMHLVSSEDENVLKLFTFTQEALDASNVLVAGIAGLNDKINAVKTALEDYDEANPTTTKYLFNGVNYNTLEEAQAALDALATPQMVWVVDGTEYFDSNNAHDAWINLAAQKAQITTGSFDSGSPISDGTAVNTLTPHVGSSYSYFKYNNMVYATLNDAETALVTALNLSNPKTDAVQGAAVAAISGYNETVDVAFDFGNDPTAATVAGALAWDSGATTGDAAADEVGSNVSIDISASTGTSLAQGESQSKTSAHYIESSETASWVPVIAQVSAPVAPQAAVQGIWTQTVAGKTLTVTGPVDGSDISSGSDNPADYVDFTPYVAQQDATLTVKGDLSSTSFENYTVTLGAGFDGSNVDLSNITLTEDTAPNPGGPTAGEWSGTINGATVTIVGPSDGTNGASLAAGANNDLTAAFDYTAVVVAVDATLALKVSGLPTGFTPVLGSESLDTAATSIPSTLSVDTAPSEEVVAVDGVYSITVGDLSWDVTHASIIPDAGDIAFTASGGSAAVPESRVTTYTLELSSTPTSVTHVVNGDPTGTDPDAIVEGDVSVVITATAKEAVPWSLSNLSATETANIESIAYDTEVTDANGVAYNANDLTSSVVAGQIYDGNFYNTIGAAQTAQISDFNINSTASATHVTVSINSTDYDFETLQFAYNALITMVDISLTTLSDKTMSNKMIVDVTPSELIYQ